MDSASKKNDLDSLLESSVFKHSGPEWSNKMREKTDCAHYTSPELDRTIETLEKRIQVSSEVSGIHIRVQETLRNFERRDGDLHDGLAKRKRVAERTRVLMEGLLHAQEIGSTRVRKMLKGLKQWTFSHDKSSTKEEGKKNCDSDGSESSSDEENDRETMDLDDIRTSERETAAMVHKLGGANSKIKIHFVAALENQQKLFDMKLTDEKQKLDREKVRVKEANHQLEQRRKEARQKDEEIKLEQKSVRCLELKIRKKELSINDLKSEVEKAKRDVEQMRSSMRKVSPDGLTTEDLRAMVETLSAEKIQLEEALKKNIIELDGYKVSLGVVQNQLTTLGNKMAKYEELNQADELTYDTNGDEIEEAVLRVKKKYERKLIDLTDEFESEKRKMEQREKVLRVNCESQISLVVEQSKLKAAKFKEDSIRKENDFTQKLELLEAQCQKSMKSLEETLREKEHTWEKERISLQNTHIIEVRTIKKDCDKWLKEMSAGLQAELKSSRQQLLLMEAQLVNSRSETDKKLLSQREESEEVRVNDIEKLVLAHEKEIKIYKSKVINSVDNDNKSLLRFMKAKHEEIENMRREYAQKIEIAESGWQALLANEKKKYEKRRMESDMKLEASDKNEMAAEMLLHRLANISNLKNVVKQEQYDEIKNRMEDMRNQIAVKDLHIDTLKSTLRVRVDEVTGLKHRSAGMNGEISLLKDEISALKWEIQEMEKQHKHAASWANNPTGDLHGFVPKHDVETLVTKLVEKIDTLERQKNDTVLTQNLDEDKQHFRKDQSLSNFLTDLSEQYEKCATIVQSVSRLLNVTGSGAKGTLLSVDNGCNERVLSMKENLQKTLSMCKSAIIGFRTEISSYKKKETAESSPLKVGNLLRPKHKRGQHLLLLNHTNLALRYPPDGSESPRKRKHKLVAKSGYDSVQTPFRLMELDCAEQTEKPRGGGCQGSISLHVDNVKLTSANLGKNSTRISHPHSIVADREDHVENSSSSIFVGGTVAKFCAANPPKLLVAGFGSNR
jgi:hypothetical protein